jgi:hypothetical protein
MGRKGWVDMPARPGETAMNPKISAVKMATMKVPI